LFGSKLIYEYPFIAFSGFHSTTPEGAFSISDELSHIGSGKGLRPQAGVGMHKTEKVSMTSRKGKVVACEDRHNDVRPKDRLRWAAIKII
jgi:hypothetical protein